VLFGIDVLPVRPGPVRLLGPSLEVQPHILRMGDGGVLEGSPIIGEHLAMVERPGDRHPAIALGDLLERAAIFLCFFLGLGGLLGVRTDEPALQLSLAAVAVRLLLPIDVGLALAGLLAAAAHAAHHAAAHPRTATLLGVAISLFLLLRFLPFLDRDSIAFL